MPPLYVVQQGAQLKVHNRRLEVELDGERLADAPLGQVDQVILFGNVGLTTPAIAALLEQECEVIFLSANGRFRGRLAGEVTPHVPLRRAQYRRLEEGGFGLEMAKGFVRAKLEHQRALLLRHNRKQGDPDIAAAAGRVGQGLAEVGRKTGLPSLLGVEGAATAAYFGGLRRLFDPAWNFNERNRRPPRDPVNVLLSFGYTLLGSLATGAVQAAGLDPYAGFLHEIVYNRPALGLDLLEEFRPVVDGVALWCLNSGQLTRDDFSPGPAERPVVLSEAGVKRFVQAFETRLEGRFTHPVRKQKLSLRQNLLEQARQIAGRVQSGEAGYTGMGFR